MSSAKISTYLSLDILTTEKKKNAVLPWDYT